MVGAVIFSHSLRKSANSGDSSCGVSGSMIPELYSFFNSSRRAWALRLLPFTGIPRAKDFCLRFPFLSYRFKTAV